MDMYGKCRALAKAQEVFDNLQDQDGIAWNVLIANYDEHEHVEEALKWFKSTYGMVSKVIFVLGIV